MFCGRCGSENPDDHSYCSGCGSTLTGETNSVAASSAPTLDGTLGTPQAPTLDATLETSGSVAAPPRLGPGSVLEGRFRLGEPLGAGGMGTVFLAHDERLRRDVVVKFPHPALLSEPGFRERFASEIQHLTRLQHPHIVKVYDAGEEHDLPYVVVEHLGGGSLGDRLYTSERAQRPDEVLEWLPALADALDFMHRNGVVHRDIKPDNILFDEEGQPYLSDFGISKALADHDAGMSTLTRTGMLLGSPKYFAPEYVDRRFLPAGDQYSLATVVYESLSGALPHQAETLERLIVEKTTRPPANLPRDGASASDPMSSAVMRALETAPEARFESCRAFADACAGDTGWSANAPTTPAMPIPARTGRSGARRLGLWVGVGLAAVAALFVYLRVDAPLEATPPAPAVDPSEQADALEPEVLVALATSEAPESPEPEIQVAAVVRPRPAPAVAEAIVAPDPEPEPVVVVAASSPPPVIEIPEPVAPSRSPDSDAGSDPLDALRDEYRERSTAFESARFSLSERAELEERRELSKLRRAIVERSDFAGPLPELPKLSEVRKADPRRVQTELAQMRRSYEAKRTAYQVERDAMGEDARFDRELELVELRERIEVAERITSRRQPPGRLPPGPGGIRGGPKPPPRR